MSFFRFIKEKYLSLIFYILINLISNIYLISINVFQNNIDDLIYLNCVILIIYLVNLFVEFAQWKNRYSEIYKCYKNKKDIGEEYIFGDTISEELMRYIVSYKDNLNNKESKIYEEKLKDMEEYISKWVHEIKLPISALNMIIEDIDEDKIADRVKNEVEKISFLVNSVMYGSRSTAASEDIFIREENLGEIVRKSIKNNAYFLIKNSIEVSMKNLNYNVHTDGKWMCYILDQLINNSIKYTSPNGKIEFNVIEEDKEIVLEIKDNGIGIVKEDINRIFDKGFTGSNGRNKIYKSTGMGLYFTKKIIDKLEHKIEVESKEGKYTIFKIRFSKITDYLKGINVAEM